MRMNLGQRLKSTVVRQSLACFVNILCCFSVQRKGVSNSFLRRISRVLAVNNVETKSLKTMFQEYIRDKAHVELKDDSPCLNATYRVSCSNLVLVEQYLPYVQRHRENKLIVKHFKERQELRVTGGADKMCNPLIALSGAPGSGKSSFFANFPCSTEYTEYCEGKPAIVVPLTFDSQMEDVFKTATEVYPTLGLRMLFGAAMVMRDEEPVDTSSSSCRWVDFLHEFSAHCFLDVYDSVRLLQEVYGNRRVLVMVDALAKCKQIDDDDVIRGVGSLLAGFTSVDVVMSSLSPMYIEQLVRRKNYRYMSGVILGPLVESELGHVEAHQWSETMLSRCRKAAADIDEPVMNFLRSVPLLCSGHPRSIQRLVESFDDKYITSVWKKTIECISESTSSSKVTLPTVMTNVFSDMTNDNHPVYGQLKLQIPKYCSLKTMVEALDVALQFNIAGGPHFQSNLENGAVFILPQSDYSSTQRSTISLVSFLQSVDNIAVLKSESSSSALMTEYPRVDAAVKLFEKAAANSGELFERAVALSVVCHSHRIFDEVKVNVLFACNRIPSRSIPRVLAPRLTLRLASTVDAMIIPANGQVANECVSAPRCFPGFDARVTIRPKDAGPAQFYYMKSSVAPKVGQNMSEARVNVIESLVMHYFCTLRLAPSDQLASFRSLYAIFFEWGTHESVNIVSRSAVRGEIEAIFGTVESGLEQLSDAKASQLSSSSSASLATVRDRILTKYVSVESNSAIYASLEREVQENKLLRQHMRQCFEVFLTADDVNVGDVSTTVKPSDSVRAYKVNRTRLEEWLVPPVSPIPYLMEAIGV